MLSGHAYITSDPFLLSQSLERIHKHSPLPPPILPLSTPPIIRKASATPFDAQGQSWGGISFDQVTRALSLSLSLSLSLALSLSLSLSVSFSVSVSVSVSLSLSLSFSLSLFLFLSHSLSPSLSLSLSLSNSLSLSLYLSVSVSTDSLNDLQRGGKERGGWGVRDSGASPPVVSEVFRIFKGRRLESCRL